MSVQPDLFGEYDAEQERLADRERLRWTWRLWLRAPLRPVPWDTQDGRREGDLSDDWWCCPGCGAVDFGAYSFWLSHGFHPKYVGDVPWAWESHGGCHRTIGNRQAALGVPGTEPREQVAV